HRVYVVVLAVGRQLGLPAVVHLPGQVAEHGGAAGGAVVPVGTQVSAAWQFEIAAIVKEDDASAVGRTLGALMIHPHGGRDRGSKVVLQDAIQHFLAFLDVIHEGVAVVVHGHHPSAQITAVVERTGDVGFHTIAVPRSHHCAAAGGKFTGGLLAHQI